MAVGRNVENHIEGFKADLNEIAADKVEFFKWFAASGQTIDQMFKSGYLDFNVHILNPLLPFISNVPFKSILEIGYGGGRILKHAAELFDSAYGIDIHEQQELVKNELISRSIKNVELFVSDGKKLPMEDSSIQIVYSFIVFQHLQYIEIFENYLKEVYRVLEPKGFAVIYFGRFYNYSLGSKNQITLKLDQLKEAFFCPKYSEINARVNETNLRVSFNYAKKMANNIGFDVVKRLVSYRGLPTGFGKYGGQNGFILYKP